MWPRADGPKAAPEPSAAAPFDTLAASSPHRQSQRTAPRLYPRQVVPAPVFWARPTQPQQTSVQPVGQTLRRVHLAQKLLAGDTPDAVDAQALCATIQ